MKALIEKRNALLEEMQGIVNKAETETRAFSEQEDARFAEIKTEISNIDSTIKSMDEMRAFEKMDCKASGTSAEETEERAFAKYILENRTGEKNLTMGDNGAIIPTSIANKIIKAVKDRCPILANATIYNVKGNLKVPVWGDNTGHNIAVGFQEEFTELTADAGKFTSIDLSGYLAGALTLIGRSVENNGSFSVVNFIVNQMAEEIAAFLEGKLLNGHSSKTQGALETTNTLAAASSSAITTDELIKLQAKVKQVYQKNACWTMHPDTFTLIRTLKDANNRYLLQDDVSNEFPYRLLGKPVYLSDNMPKIATSAKAILYGDYSGLSVNIRENISIEVLREKYATQHAIGVVAWMEFDSKITDHQKLATLVMAGV